MFIRNLFLLLSLLQNEETKVRDKYFREGNNRGENILHKIFLLSSAPTFNSIDVVVGGVPNGHSLAKSRAVAGDSGCP